VKEGAIAGASGFAPGSIWICCRNAIAVFAPKRASFTWESLRTISNCCAEKNSLTSYTFGTGVAQHTFCSHCGMHAFYIPRSQPDRISVNARCLDGIDGANLNPKRFFDGRHWEEAQRKRIADGGHVPAAGLNGSVTLQRILDRASE
jgi:hypothetical protein